jgi:coniferyl-aldehyde dehydrogenase
MSLQTESSARRVFDGPASQPKATRVPSTTSSPSSPGRPAALMATLERQRAAFLRDGPPSAAKRKELLGRLRQMLMDHQEEIAAAVDRDFGHRSPHETLLAEIFVTVAAIKHMSRHVASWMRPERRSVALQFWPARAQVVYQPLGVVGVISPWNYPVGLALGPLAAALAAGNRVMLKPSEFTPATSALLERLLSETFSAEQVAVVAGDADIGAAFAALPCDHLLFTGSSTATGRLIMRAASENLVPVTLELGGKSPVLVDAAYPLERAAYSIAAGKLVNAGQTCVAPDYVLVPEGEAAHFAALFANKVEELYPSLVSNPDYSAVINPRHYARLRALVDDARSKGASVIEINPAGEDLLGQAGRKLPPTLLLGVTDDMAVMQEEIFGPVLPVKTYGTLDEAIAYINGGPRPLALYYFGENQSRQREVLARTTSGGITINDTMLHYLQEDLPFGGVGPSGMGAYHGQQGFRTLSHAKSVLRQARFNASWLVRPPYGKLLDRVLAVLMR